MPSNGGRRMSTGAGMQSVGSRLSSQTQSTHYGYGQHTGTGRIMPRSGSDQHLPRVDYTSITTPARHTLLRSSLKSGSQLYTKIVSTFFFLILRSFYVISLLNRNFCVEIQYQIWYSGR